jgi:hypothetical protein
MRRHVRKVTSPNGLQWTIKRLVVPLAMRPLDRIAILDAATPRRTIVDGMAGRVPDAFGAWTGPLPLGFIFLPLALPLLPFVLFLRRLRLLPWTVEARAHPWGRRFPPMVFTYEVRGHEDTLRVLDQVAEALARGDGAPDIPGAENIREPRSAQGAGPAVAERAANLYGGR